MDCWLLGRNFSVGSTSRKRRTTMPFRLRKDARDWFKGISEDLPLDFDVYYFCLMAVAGVRKTGFPPATVEPGIVSHVPWGYRCSGPVIVFPLFIVQMTEVFIKYVW